MNALALALGPLLAGATLVVTPDGPYRTPAEALAAAQAGDTIEVRGGVYHGALVIDRPVTLLGVGRPVLDGGERGTVVTVAAADVSLRGFAIRGSGSSLNDADAGVEVKAPRARIEDNVLEDVLYGVSLDDAPGSVVQGNAISGKPLAAADRGDAIRLWYSADVLVAGNRVAAARDCVVWYSERVTLTDNVIEGGRYGLHLMYDDAARIERNVIRDNSVGVYLMYSREVALRGNLLAANRGPSGYGLGLKDVDNLTAEDNWVVDNRVGIWSDTTPRELDAVARYRGNQLIVNDIGVALQPSTQRNTFWDNAFRDNLEQVSVQGGGTLRDNAWESDGRGNFWSDYRGFDADGDGVGDVPYRADALLGEMMDRRPEFRFFQFGLATGAVELATRAFPALRPQPKLADSAPLMAPPPTPAPPAEPARDPVPGVAAGLGLLALACGVLGLRGARADRGRLEARPSRVRRGRAATVAATAAEDAAPPLAVRGLGKRFGETLAVDHLSFEVAPGETVAIWGPNGAGKTTVIKCILGLLPCRGQVLVAGRDALRDGPAARRALGYVPQEVAFHDDLTGVETIALHARLKRVPARWADGLVETLGLAGHLQKPVGTLSGGLRQRLALLLALLNDPALLLLDEPTSNLDAATREQIARLLDEVRRSGTAIVFASHRLDEVEALADRVLVLEQGRLVYTCAPRELSARLGLRTHLRLRLERDERERALAALRAAGLAPSANGTLRTIGVDVRPSDKALPIRVLERAGVAVADFSVEDAVRDAAAEELR